MGHCAQRPKKRKIKVVGGGTRYTRDSTGKKSGSMKALRRVARKSEKAKKKNKR